MPGRVALFLCPNILKKLSRNVYSICVTGTNGKTTTCALIEYGFKNSNKKCFSNKSGANMLSGVATAFVLNSNAFGRPKGRYAILECDENSLPHITKYIDPKIIVVTNLFRDQLDRYGEINTTFDKIKEGIANASNPTLIQNGDCPFYIKYSNSITFGIDDNLNIDIPSDSLFCPICHYPLFYKSKTYAHLGDYYCKCCGFSRPKIDYCASAINGSTFKLNGVKTYTSLKGIYNIYNYLSAVSVLDYMGIEYSSLSYFTGAFGRMERFSYNGNEILLLLVKNPVGFGNCINLVKDNLNRNIVFALNDNSADGTDVSWIWDVDFKDIASCTKKVYTIGMRSYDMALRLKYDDVSSVQIDGEMYDELVSILKGFHCDSVVFASYTSMMKMRHYFIKAFGGDEFWQ